MGYYADIVEIRVILHAARPPPESQETGACRDFPLHHCRSFFVEETNIAVTVRHLCMRHYNVTNVYYESVENTVAQSH